MSAKPKPDTTPQDPSVDLASLKGLIERKNSELDEMRALESQIAGLMDKIKVSDKKEIELLKVRIASLEDFVVFTVQIIDTLKTRALLQAENAPQSLKQL